MSRKIIGEGSYGCVHKPSIRCKTPPEPGFNYKNYVSKIMKTKNAKKELEDFLVIQRIDPNSIYHLGEPILCEPDLTEKNVKKDIQKCKRIKLTESDEEPELSLLLMKYGGPDLKALCKKELSDYLKTNKVERVDNFLLEIHHLLKGIQFFKENGLVHNDIKPQNILFNPKNGKLKYIDFGLMRTKEAIIESSKKNKNFLGIFHWSYPLECGFMDKSKYEKYKNLTVIQQNKLKKELTNMIINNKKTNTFQLPIKHPDAFETLFTYLDPHFQDPTKALEHSYIDSFFDGYNELVSSHSYNNVLNQIVDSIDVYGLGFTLQFIINCFKRHSAFDQTIFTRLSHFFKKMYDFNPLTRVIDLNKLIDEYQDILHEIGVLKRLGKSFEKQNVVANNASLLKYEENSVDCPPNKEPNPSTARCVKKCKSGFSRNTQFKCKKTRKVKTTSNSNSKTKSNYKR